MQAALDPVRIKCLGFSFGHPENFVIISEESQASPADVNDTRGRFLRDGKGGKNNTIDFEIQAVDLNGEPVAKQIAVQALLYVESAICSGQDRPALDIISRTSKVGKDGHLEGGNGGLYFVNKIGSSLTLDKRGRGVVSLRILKKSSECGHESFVLHFMPDVQDQELIQAGQVGEVVNPSSETSTLISKDQARLFRAADVSGPIRVMTKVNARDRMTVSAKAFSSLSAGLALLKSNAGSISGNDIEAMKTLANELQVVLKRVGTESQQCPEGNDNIVNNSNSNKSLKRSNESSPSSSATRSINRPRGGKTSGVKRVSKTEPGTDNKAATTAAAAAAGLFGMLASGQNMGGVRTTSPTYHSAQHAASPFGSPHLGHMFGSPSSGIVPQQHMGAAPSGGLGMGMDLSAYLSNSGVAQAQSRPVFNNQFGGIGSLNYGLGSGGLSAALQQSISSSQQSMSGNHEQQCQQMQQIQQQQQQQQQLQQQLQRAAAQSIQLAQAQQLLRHQSAALNQTSD